MSEITVMGPHLEEDHDLRTILALYDSNDLLTKLEEAVRVLNEVIPTGLVDHEELLDDALAVVCGDLCQIMELGVKDPSLITLLAFLREMCPTAKPSVTPHPRENIPRTTETDPAQREVLFAAVIDVFKSSSSRQKFLAFLEDDGCISDLYLSFAPLRNQADCKRISKALSSLPQVTSGMTSQVAPPVSVCTPTRSDSSDIPPQDEIAQMREHVPEIVVNSPERVAETAVSTVASTEAAAETVTARTKLGQHTRSRSNLDHIPVTRTPPGRRLSFSRINTPASLPERTERTEQSERMLCASPCYFSPPKPGQSLIGYLQSQDTETCADMERENAHFFVSDVIIAAVEQMQYERRHGKGRWGTGGSGGSGAEGSGIGGAGGSGTSDGSSASSGVESPNLMTYSGMVSDGQSSSTGTTSGSLEEDNGTLSFSLLPIQTMEGTASSSTSQQTWSLDDKEDSLPLPVPVPVPVPVPLPLKERNWRGGGTDHPSNSAEAVAVSLLRQFNECHLLQASEMEWIVGGECDVPQTLLPLPKSTFISPDASPSSFSQLSELPEQGRIRGNLEWAPLRPQVIYHIQPHVTLKVGIVSQKYRCAGCGGKMDTYQEGRMRFCEYTGKYFCVCCHDYKTSIIPARLLLKWDFTKHYVCNYAFDFIARIYRDPLFDVNDCNVELYKKSKILTQTRLIRTQLVLAVEYVRTCRQAQSAMDEVEQLPKFVWEQIHTYSLDLFCSVKDGVFPTFLKPVAELAVQHVVNCQFCCSKGFICEFCRIPTPVFPFQLTTVFQCEKCFSCFHINCLKKKPCPKCARLQARRAAAPTALTT